VKEVRAAVADINIWALDFGMGMIPPVHILMHGKDESVAIAFHPEGPDSSIAPWEWPPTRRTSVAEPAHPQQLRCHPGPAQDELGR